MVSVESFFGVIQNEYLRSILMLVVAFALAQLVYHIFKYTLTEITKKTKTKTDDLIVEVVTLPIYYILIFAGIYFALKSLTFVASYAGSIDRIFFVLLIILSAVIFARVTDVFVNSWLKAQNKKTPKLVNKIVNLSIYTTALLMILQFFEVQITPLLATLGLGALAVGLALQPTLANLFAGVRLLSDRPIGVGDFIEVGKDLSGYVEDIGWNSTRIRTITRNIVIIPNSKLADSIITNNSMPQTDMGLMIKCGVDYRSNLKKVEKVTLEVANKIQKTVPGAVKDFKPFMRFKNFGDSNINFFVVLRAETHIDKYMLTHEFIKALKQRYDKEKIEISWPIMKIFSNKR